MMKIFQTVLLLALSLFSLAALALPSAFTATYSVSKSGLKLGDMNLSLSYNNQTYQYSKTSKARGLAALLSGDRMVENVKGRFQGNYIQPQSYLFHHTSKRKNRKDAFRFTSQTQVTGKHKDTPYNVTIPKGTLDRASLEIALARDVSANKAQLSYTVVERGKIKTYHIRRAGNEQLIIGGKQYNTQKLVVSRNNKNRTTIFWLAKELGYMPVQINHTEKGSPIITQLKRFQFTK